MQREVEMQKIIKSKCFRLASIFPVGLLVFLGLQTGSYFITACGICSTLFWLVGRQLIALMGKTHNVQIKICKPIGYLLLLPQQG